MRNLWALYRLDIVTGGWQFRLRYDQLVVQPTNENRFQFENFNMNSKTLKQPKYQLLRAIKIADNVRMLMFYKNDTVVYYRKRFSPILFLL